jgi:hypothetical protein
MKAMCRVKPIPTPALPLKGRERTISTLPLKGRWVFGSPPFKGGAGGGMGSPLPYKTMTSARTSHSPCTHA